MTSIFNTSREYARMHVCANFVTLALICDELSCRQGKVYGQTDGQTDGRTDRWRQRQFPFSLKGRGVKLLCWSWWTFAMFHIGGWPHQRRVEILVKSVDPGVVRNGPLVDSDYNYGEDPFITKCGCSIHGNGCFNIMTSARICVWKDKNWLEYPSLYIWLKPKYISFSSNKNAQHSINISFHTKWHHTIFQVMPWPAETCGLNFFCIYIYSEQQQFTKIVTVNAFAKCVGNFILSNL